MSWNIARHGPRRADGGPRIEILDCASVLSLDANDDASKEHLDWRGSVIVREDGETCVLQLVTSGNDGRRLTVTRGQPARLTSNQAFASMKLDS
jgi:hypothetical protein